MWEKIRVIWQIPELRTKIGLTLLMLAIYRIEADTLTFCYSWGKRPEQFSQGDSITLIFKRERR